VCVRERMCVCVCVYVYVCEHIAFKFMITIFCVMLCYYHPTHTYIHSYICIHSYTYIYIHTYIQPLKHATERTITVNKTDTIAILRNRMAAMCRLAKGDPALIRIMARGKGIHTHTHAAYPYVYYTHTDAHIYT